MFSVFLRSAFSVESPRQHCRQQCQRPSLRQGCRTESPGAPPAAMLAPAQKQNAFASCIWRSVYNIIEGTRFDVTTTLRTISPVHFFSIFITSKMTKQ